VKPEGSAITDRGYRALVYSINPRSRVRETRPTRATRAAALLEFVGLVVFVALVLGGDSSPLLKREQVPALQTCFVFCL